VGDVIMLKDTNGDGVADMVKTVASRPNMHGIAIDGRKVYLVTIKEIYVADIKDDGTFGQLQCIVDDLPDAGQHADRTLAVGPTACSMSAWAQPAMFASRTTPRTRACFRSNLTAARGAFWHRGFATPSASPSSLRPRQLYGWDHGIDWLGDDDQPEELLIVEGHKYGWPYIYGSSKKNVQHQPPADITHDDWAQSSDEPVLMYTPHAAPMQFVFYGGAQFPPEYRGDAAAMHGSWNRKPPSGYEVLRVHFEDGKPKSAEPFVTGFLTRSGNGEYGFVGRPFGLAVGKDGSLFIGDDANGAIYRVTYDNAKTTENSGMTANIKPPKNAALAEQDTPKELATEILGAKDEIKVSSPAFDNGKTLDIRYSAYGDNVSPGLSWSRGPQGTKSYALIMEDPDAPKPKPVVHWLLFNVPADVTHLREGIPGAPALEEPKSAMQGTNTRGTTGYFGPRPPGNDPHHYHFQIFALDTTLALKPGAKRKDVLDAMRGHVLAQGDLVAEPWPRREILRGAAQITP
jgi:Raf kinase inhibitor-like YbhB/YbcL family protein